MIKKKLFGVSYAVTGYDEAADLIIQSGLAHKSFGMSALAVHGLVESVHDRNFRGYLEKMDLIVPDGQPIKWALNSFHKAGLQHRVAGPVLTKHVLAKGSRQQLRVFLYGSTAATLERMQQTIRREYPGIVICGVHADRFRDATPEEDAADIKKINESGANLVLVGRGCPRQEKWVANHIGKINAPMMAVGAAFDFLAGNINHAPTWMQNSGLEWLYRLVQDPKKLWKRYLTTNSYFIYLIILCKLGMRKVQF